MLRVIMRSHSSHSCPIRRGRFFLRLSAFLASSLAFALAFSLASSPAAAQTPPSWTESVLGGASESGEDGDASGRPTVAELRSERESVEEEIQSLRAEIETRDPAGSQTPDEATATGGTAGGTAGGTTDDGLVQASRLRALEKIRSLLGQQIDELRRTESLEQATEDLATRKAEGVAALVDHPPPFSFEDLDAVLSRLESSQARRVLLDDTVAAGVEALDEAERRLRLAEQARSAARERAESAPADERAAAEAALDDAARAARLAEEEVAQLRLQQANDRRELELVAERTDFLSRGVEWLQGQLRPSEEALEARLARLAADQGELRERLAELRREAQREENRLLRAQSDGRSAEAEASRTALDLLDHRQRLLEERIDRRDVEAELWRLRHRLASTPAPETEARREIAGTVGRDLAELERDKRLLSARLQDLRGTQERLADRLLDRPEPEDAPSLRRREDLLAEQISFVEEQIADLDDVMTLARRVASEADVAGLGAGEFASGLWQRVVSLWRWEITVVEQRPITLGKVILALLLLIAGYVASKRVSLALGRVLQQRFGLSSGAAAALQNIAFYLMVVAFVIWALQLVSIPLTVFTLLGGVLAIGIGFGSQNVVNNFISGLILMVERPVKVGDLIEVDGTVGSVERIGLRSARVRSGDNTHIIVPNSTFLEQKVLNWTVTDDLVRTQVDVGIAYGSLTREAEKLMKRALDEEPKVVQNMPKEIHFLEFGDNALHFRAYFWIRVRVPLDKQRVGSALRFRIDELFAEAGIVIAFPQRDVHLDTLSPLQVRLLGRADEGSETGSETGPETETRSGTEPDA